MALVIAGVTSSPAQAAVKHAVAGPHVATVPVYDSLQSPLPGNQESVSYEATSASELGQQIEFSRPSVTLSNVVVTMSSWQCEYGGWTVPNNGTNTDTEYCYTPDFGTSLGSFSVPITVNIYNVGSGNTLGSLITTATQTFTIYDRPTSNSSPSLCGGDETVWYQSSSGDCFHGYAQNITFTGVSGVTLPQKVIFGIAFNTSDHGSTPQRPKPCNTADNGCGYDSLNVALNSNESVLTPGNYPEPLPPSVGSDPGPAGTTWYDSSYAGFYCDDGGTGNTDVGTFREDSPSKVGPDGCGNTSPANNFDESPAGYDPSVEFNISTGTEIELYVAPAADGGVDTGTCTLASAPCASINYALEQEALLASGTTGSVINLAKGTYLGAAGSFNALAAANNGVTITGAGKKTILEPTACANLTAITGTSPESGDSAMVAFNTGIDGVSVENVDLDGAGVATCPGYVAGAIITDGTTGDAVVGDLVQSGATFGILTDDNADSTVISNVLSPVLCSGKVTGPNTGLNAGWTSPANLKVNKIPACAKFTEAGHGEFTGVFVNGVAYCATPSATGNTIVLTGTGNSCTPVTNSGGIEIPKGATVVYNTSVAPFTQWGIACNSPLQAEDQTTDCAVSDNTVTAGGTGYTNDPATCAGFPPVGLLATGGATANFDGNTVSGVSDNIVSCPEAGESTNSGIGIGLLPDGIDGCTAGSSQVGVNNLNSPATGAGNKVSSNGTGITVAGNLSPLCTTANPTFEVNGNSASGNADAGIVLTDLLTTNGSLGSAMENNSATGSLTGEGIVLSGVEGATIGGPLASEGNSASGDGVGFVLAPCVASAEPACGVYALKNGGAFAATTGNKIQNNSSTGNELYGVLDIGNYQPNEIAQSTSVPLESGTNTFNGNTWTGNSAGSPLVDGANVMDGTGWGGGCVSESGDCGTGLTLEFEGANTTFSSSYPGTATVSLSVCNLNANSEVLPVGTEITFEPDAALGISSGQAGDGGTFYVTKDAIITGDNCTVAGSGYPLMVQALNPQEVGTTSSPTGQSYILGTGDTINVNANGADVAGLNTYGHGATANSCTPAGNGGEPNVFGATSTSGYTYSTTLGASSGGVNATYNAC